MTNPVPIAEIWRGPFLESLHFGDAVVCDGTGQIVRAWGDPDKVVLPRSSSKMIQALPLLESGAAEAFGLDDARLALACASHQGAEIHSRAVLQWLGDIGCTDDDFRCGPQEPRDIAARDDLIRCGDPVCRYHNNCSGKHTGFLTLAKHLGAGPDYVALDHPVQQACRAAFEDLTQETISGHAVDGCSAPNFASSMQGMARAMAYFANADRDSARVRDRAAARLRDAMATYPELVAGEGRACTHLMRATEGRVSVKTGAEGYFVAIVPERGMGVAVKATDGAGRAAECAITAILVGLGVLDANHPVAQQYINGTIRNWDGLETGKMRATPDLMEGW